MTKYTQQYDALLPKAFFYPNSIYSRRNQKYPSTLPVLKDKTSLEKKKRKKWLSLGEKRPHRIVISVSFFVFLCIHQQQSHSKTEASSEERFLKWFMVFYSSEWKREEQFHIDENSFITNHIRCYALANVSTRSDFFVTFMINASVSRNWYPSNSFYTSHWKWISTISARKST